MGISNPKGGTIAVYFDPSSPAVGATLSGTLAAVPTTGSGDPIYEETGNWTRVNIAGSQIAASLLISGQQVAGTNRPFIVNTDGAIKIYDIVTGTIATVTTVATVTNVTNTVGVRFTDEPTVIASGKQGTTTRPFIANTDGAIKVYDIVTGTIATVSAVTNITNSIAVHVLSTGGTIAVKIDPGYNVVNASSTIVLPRTVSGSASGVSVSGNTLVSPVTSRLIKVYALALSTTAQVHLNARFTNGAGTSPTEFWRYGLQAPSQGIAGANLAVSPPSYLFATASSSTLSLLLDSASLVHYSVGYYLESA